MIILVINCGSSSIKYQLLDMKNDDVYELLAKGIVEKIGLECGRLQHTPVGKQKVVKDLPVPDHTVGMQIVPKLSSIKPSCSARSACSLV